MDGPVTDHRNVNPPSLVRPRGYSHATVAAAGRTVYVGGQTGCDADGRYPDGLVDQFDRAAGNVVTALEAAGARPEHLVWMQIFTTDAAAYGAASREIGEAYRRRFGNHYPAMALVEVPRLFDGEALVELVGIAVVPG
ncbi:MAG TPA: RidA family protein [Actinomycetota bacterium]|nr:RidA family protein [Actinomycetota bacterium]